MKQAEYKSELRRRVTLLWANTKFTYQRETAYRANNWANVLSTVFYTISMILFLDVIYGNVTNIAGYTRDETMLFMFMGQIGYYTSWIIHANLKELIEDVNSGNLDMLLTKPVPALFYITFKKVKIFAVVRDCVPPMIVLTLAINWNNISLNPLTAITGILILCMGLICAHVIHFLAAIPVFWLGESTAILEMSEEFEYNTGKIIPIEGFSTNVRLFFTTLVPVMVSAGVSTSVLLGKTPIFPTSISVLLVTLGALSVRQYVWHKALKAYTSASS